MDPPFFVVKIEEKKLKFYSPPSTQKYLPIFGLFCRCSDVPTLAAILGYLEGCKIKKKSNFYYVFPIYNSNLHDICSSRAHSPFKNPNTA